MREVSASKPASDAGQTASKAPKQDEPSAAPAAKEDSSKEPSKDSKQAAPAQSLKETVQASAFSHLKSSYNIPALSHGMMDRGPCFVSGHFDGFLSSFVYSYASEFNDL